MERAALETYLATFLQVHDFRDYCPNGLQVEGRPEITRIVTGVTASTALIEAAIADGADALLVHHGYFWRGEDARITGMHGRRLGLLFRHELNLFAYHLPLDAHPEVGNNAALARQLGLEVTVRFGDFALELVLSGPLVPMTLMPAWVQQVAAYLPFQWTFFFPIEALVGIYPPRSCSTAWACRRCGSSSGSSR